jgi:hypothetical protein
MKYSPTHFRTGVRIQSCYGYIDGSAHEYPEHSPGLEAKMSTFFSDDKGG